MIELAQDMRRLGQWNGTGGSIRLSVVNGSTNTKAGSALSVPLYCCVSVHLTRSIPFSLRATREATETGTVRNQIGGD